jgi:PAS domain S-box-containing protein
MTSIDILILSVVGYAAVVFLRGHRRPGRGTESGFVAILGGLLLVALFYLADLLVMHAFPSFMPRAEAMSIMRELHLNGSWLVALLGIGTICFGFASVNRATTALVGDLEARERDLGREIAERKQIEQNLRESEAHYRDIFDEGPSALWIEDWSRIKQMVDRLAEEGVEDWHAYFANNRDRLAEAYDLAIGLECSNANLEIYGVSSKKALLARIQAAQVQPDELDAFAKIVIGIIEGKSSGIIESLDDRTDGTNIMIRSQYVVPLAHRHDWSRLIYSLEDITDRKRAEEALREGEARLRKAAEMAKIGYWLWDKIDDKAIYCSKELAKIYGLSSGEALAANLSSFGTVLEWIHPKDRERYARGAMEATETKRGIDIEYRILRRDGSVRHVHETHEPIIDEQGQLIRSSGVTQDITTQREAEKALRKSEERFVSALNNITEAFALYDSDDRLVMFNDAYRKHHSGDLEKLLKPGLKFEDLVRARAYSGEAPTERGGEEAYIAERMERHRICRGPFETQRKGGW